MLFFEFRQIMCKKEHDRQKKKNDRALVDPCRGRNTEYMCSPEEQLHNKCNNVKNHSNPDTDFVKSSQ
jgi:hypothetical protein